MTATPCSRAANASTGLGLRAEHPRFVVSAMRADSQLVRASGTWPDVVAPDPGLRPVVAEQPTPRLGQDRWDAIDYGSFFDDGPADRRPARRGPPPRRRRAWAGSPRSACSACRTCNGAGRAPPFPTTRRPRARPPAVSSPGRARRPARSPPSPATPPWPLRPPGWTSATPGNGRRSWPGSSGWCRSPSCAGASSRCSTCRAGLPVHRHRRLACPVRLDIRGGLPPVARRAAGRRPPVDDRRGAAVGVRGRDHRRPGTTARDWPGARRTSSRPARCWRPTS